MNYQPAQTNAKRLLLTIKPVLNMDRYVSEKDNEKCIQKLKTIQIKHIFIVFF